MKQFRVIPCLMLLSLALIGSQTTVRAEDKEFAPIINQLQLQYKAKHRKVPMMGLANLAVKLVRPAGVKSFKLAIFEDLQFDETKNNFELSSFVRQTLSNEWKPLVRVNSRLTREQTHIYVKGDGNKDLRLMIVNVDGSDAVVVRVRINPNTLVKWMDNPKIMGISLTSKNERKKSVAQTVAENNK